MCPSTRTATPASPAALPTGRMVHIAMLGGMLCGALIAPSAQAQMVPRAEHFLHQGQTSGVTAVRLRWGGAPVVEETRGQGLALKGADAVAALGRPHRRRHRPSRQPCA